MDIVLVFHLMYYELMYWCSEKLINYADVDGECFAPRKWIK